VTETCSRRNEALFFRVVCDNIDEIQPLIYTPTVDLPASVSPHLPAPRALFISANDRGRIAELLGNWPYPARLIVVTDGERIWARRPRRPRMAFRSASSRCIRPAPASTRNTCLPVMLDVAQKPEFLNIPIISACARNA